MAEEISLSIEETNRLRAELGLKPLDVDAPEKKKPRTDVAPTAQAPRGNEGADAAVGGRDAEEFRERIAKAREERLQQAASGDGKSLGELLAEQTEDASAQGWLHQSRAAGRKRPASKSARTERAAAVMGLDARYHEEDDAAQQAGAAEMEGLRVAHGADDFKLGEGSVLTLQDQPLLERAGLGYSLAEASDTLENVNMAEDQRRRRAREEAKVGGYGREVDAYGDRRGMLHKYDGASNEGEGLVLDSSGSVDVHAQQREKAAARAQLQGKTAYDLSSYCGTSAAAVAAAAGEDGAGGAGGAGGDYLTRAEETAAAAEAAAGVAKFRKGKGPKTKRHRRKRAEEPLAPACGDDTGATAGPDLGTSADRELRARHAQQQLDEQRADRADRYTRAVAVATREARAVLVEDSQGRERGRSSDPGGFPSADCGGTASTSARIAKLSAALAPRARPADVMGSSAQGVEEDAEVDVELYSALARTREARAAKAKAETKTATAADLVALTLRERQARQDRGGGAAVTAGDGAASAGASVGQGAGDTTSGGTAVFSQTTEFLGGVVPYTDGADADLPSEQLRAARALQGSVDADGEAAVVGGHAGAGASTAQGAVALRRHPRGDLLNLDEAGGKTGEGRTGLAEESEAGEDSEDEEAGVDFLEEQHTAAGGIAAALELARSRGFVGNAGSTELYGRANDLKGSGMHLREPTEGEDRVQLKYLDEYGRPMTQKEAFRRQCYNFHGKGPGKKRLERRQRQYEEEQRIKVGVSDTPLHMLSTLSKVQRKTHEAHIVLTGSNAIREEVIATAAADAVRPQRSQSEPGGRSKGGPRTTVA